MSRVRYQASFILDDCFETKGAPHGPFDHMSCRKSQDEHWLRSSHEFDNCSSATTPLCLCAVFNAYPDHELHSQMDDTRSRRLTTATGSSEAGHRLIRDESRRRKITRLRSKKLLPCASRTDIVWQVSNTYQAQIRCPFYCLAGPGSTVCTLPSTIQLEVA